MGVFNRWWHGNNWGAILGGALLMGLFVQGTRFLPSVAGQPQLIPALRYIAVGLLLIIVLRLRPRGLLPEKVIRAEEAGDVHAKS